MHWIMMAAVVLNVHLSEWKIGLPQNSISAGNVSFVVVNDGQIPHAFEVEGRGLEKETALIQPGQHATLNLTLEPGDYEVYCPVGNGSHEKLGMHARLHVTGAAAQTATNPTAQPAVKPKARPAAKPIHVVGGGPVIQILPGPFPFADSASRVIAMFGRERPLLHAQLKNGPYSNKVARVTGSFDLRAWDRGLAHDSVSGTAEFATQDGAHWKLLLDRVQTKDVPHHPRFGGVIEGLYYHGSTGVHTPLVPTINSAVALWAWAHLWKDGVRVTDSAAVHVMLLSHTRRAGDFALACWDCSRNPVDEMQLQITAGPDHKAIAAPGGFLFVNWEKSAAQ